MSMPIQRQSEAFGIFDDGPRFARDRSSTDLPQGLAGLVNSMGPRIQAGLLNTRTAADDDDDDYDPGEGPGYPDWLRKNRGDDDSGWDEATKKESRLAINFGKGPRDHGGAGPDGGPSVPDWYYDDDSEDEYDEDFGHDPERFIPEHLVHGNRRGSGRRPFDRAAARRLASEGLEPWMDHDSFINYLTDLNGGKAPDSISQSNIRDMSDWEMRNWHQDLEKNRGKTREQIQEEREQGKARAKQLADGLWNAVFPPEEEEGRKSVQNMDTVGRLMDNGWQPEHIKYDEDDQPYAHYQHPSGWTVTDHGGMYKEIGHVATPGESHDVINVSRNIDGQDYHAPFGPADAHDYIENQLHGDPEETGGTFQYLTQNHPAIRRYRPRQATRLAKDKDGGCTCWEGYERVPGTEPCASGSCRKKKTAGPNDWSRVRPGPMVDVPLRRQDPEDYFGWVEDDSDTCPTCNRSVRYVSGPHCRHGNLHTAAEAPMDPAQMQVPMGGGYQIGHRVGLPWRNQVIPGTVIGLDGSSVVTRWDDGQYSTEEPHNIQLL